MGKRKEKKKKERKKGEKKKRRGKREKKGKERESKRKKRSLLTFKKLKIKLGRHDNINNKGRTNEFSRKF